MIGIKQSILEDRYLNSNLILIIDLLLSFIASFVSCCCLNLAYDSNLFSFTRLSAIWLGASLVLSYLFFRLFRTYYAIIRHSSIRDMARMVYACLGKSVLLGLTAYLSQSSYMANWKIAGVTLFDCVLTICFLLGVRIAMILIYDVVKAQMQYNMNTKRIFVYGTSEKSLSLAISFMNSKKYHTVGLLTEGDAKNFTIASSKVYFYKNAEDFSALCKKYNINAILFTSEKDVQQVRDTLLSYIPKVSKVEFLIAPPIENVNDKKVQMVRAVKIEDLLGRPEIKISMDEIVANFHGKVVMVTGAAGSIGSELCRQLATFGIKQLIVFDNAETPLHNLRLELGDKFPKLEFVPIIGDVRQSERLDFVFRNYQPQVVFHAAAYKHVPLMEENPGEAVLVNVVGTRNVADKCLEYDVEKMVMISTDKAVNPTNIMGCTKRLAEIYVQSLGLAESEGSVKGKTLFVTTRFGNVLGSNGSVIPRFREQIENGGPVTVTHPEITRFFMTIPEACRLVMEAATMTEGNQIFVFDMGDSVKIVDLAKRMIDLAGLKLDTDIKIEFTGLRPGEKLYEEVLSNTENTTPTRHDRIRIAKVREYDYAEALRVVEQLEKYSRALQIPDMVKYMKKVVPEYKSNNSVYEKYDKE